MYKAKTQHWHEKNFITHNFEPGQQVLLLNSRLKLFLRNLRSKWRGTFEVLRITKHGVVELWNTDRGSILLLIGQHVKYYFGNDADCDIEVIKLNDE